MYNFELMNGENIIEIFENIWIGQEKEEKNTTVALTNQRLLFMDYNKDDYREAARISRGLNYIRTKEIYYQFHIEEITNMEEKENYIIYLTNNTTLEFNNEHLFQLIKELL